MLICMYMLIIAHWNRTPRACKWDLHGHRQNQWTSCTYLRLCNKIDLSLLSACASFTIRVPRSSHSLKKEKTSSITILLNLQRKRAVITMKNMIAIIVSALFIRFIIAAVVATPIGNTLDSANLVKREPTAVRKSNTRPSSSKLTWEPCRAKCYSAGGSKEVIEMCLSHCPLASQSWF